MRALIRESGRPGVRRPVGTASSGAPEGATRALLGGAIAAAAALLLWHAAQLLAVAGGHPLGLALGLAVGIALADVLTGLVHWACDTWGREDTPWVGPALIRGFREHHRTPEQMCTHGAIEVNGQVAVAVSAVLALLALPGAQHALASAPLAYATLWSLTAFSALANHLHLWAHSPCPPRPVRALQRSGLILSARRHMRHHRAPFATAYCISTGWTNPALDAIGFWRALERGIQAATGAEPRADCETHDPESRRTSGERTRS